MPAKYKGRPYNIFETGGTTGMPKQRIGWDDYKTDYEEFSAKLADEHFPRGARLADGRPDRPAPPAPGHRAPRQLPRQLVLLHRSRPALGEEGHRREEVRPGPRLHGPRRGPGRDHPQAPQDQRPVHHAEAARSARREGQPLRGRHPRRVLRRHHHGAAIRALHRRGSAGGAHRLLPHLRQHAHGPGGQRAAAAGGQLLHHLLRAAAARRAPRREPEPDRRRSWTTTPGAGSN